MPSEVSAFASDSERPPAERGAMERALDLARRGWGRVAPNPLVGAVVLAGDTVVGEGYHAEYGGPHAEVVALEAAGARARGATLVVNLEPCAHHGKTPPCTDAIVAAGVAGVVAALPDPDLQARGGAAALRAKGVAVSIGLLAEAAAALNAPFLFAREQAERPFVALKLATSIDGRIADAAGSSRWVSGDAAREYVHWLRAGFDAIAVGGTTALRDNPQLTVRGNVTPRKTPVRVVFDRRAMLNETADLVKTAREVPTWVMASPGAGGERGVARGERRARVPPRVARRRAAAAARRGDRVAAVRRRRGARREALGGQPGRPAVLGAGAGVARRGRRSGVSRRPGHAARRRAALGAGGAPRPGL